MARSLVVMEDKEFNKKEQEVLKRFKKKKKL